MTDFSLLIQDWYRLNKRDLPWRRTKNAYRIWLSEIIMQQTRVQQGTSYYLKFVKEFPTVNDLANADEQKVLNLWQGLGYYSRARNLHFSAKIIRDNFNGEFPTDYTDILSLKGVGNYTAAAIASFAFNENKAVVDGNVYRLLSRVFDISTPIDSSKGQKLFQNLADELIDGNSPGEHNQAIMELGALVCTPKLAKCNDCPLFEKCLSHANDTIYSRPVKEKKIKVKKRYFHFLIFKNKEHTYLEQRIEKDIWQNLYQFPMIETNEHVTGEEKKNWKKQRFESSEIKHILSHQKIHAIFHHIDSTPPAEHEKWKKILISELNDYPIPRLIDKYLKENIHLF